MCSEDRKVIELGTVRAETRGAAMGIVDSEFGMMLRLGLQDD